MDVLSDYFLLSASYTLFVVKDIAPLWMLLIIIWKFFLFLFPSVVVVAGVFLYSMRNLDSEQPSKKNTLKPQVPEIVGRALIIYHPGGTGYTEEAAYAIGRALQAKG